MYPPLFTAISLQLHQFSYIIIIIQFNPCERGNLSGKLFMEVIFHWEFFSGGGQSSFTIEVISGKGREGGGATDCGEFTSFS